MTDSPTGKRRFDEYLNEGIKHDLIKNYITEPISILKKKDRIGHLFFNSITEKLMIEKENIHIISFDQAEHAFRSGAQLIINESLPDATIRQIAGHLQLGTRLPDHLRQHVMTAAEFYNSHAHMFDARAMETANAYTELALIRTMLQFYYHAKAKTDFIQILDAGCGNGRLMIPLLDEKYNIYGIDISSELIIQAQLKKPQYQHRFQVGNLLELPYSAHHFDVVLMLWHVISELSTCLDLTFKELHRVLKPHGLLMFDLPNKTSDSIKQHYQGGPNHEGFELFLAKIPEMDVLKQALERNGFAIDLIHHATLGVDKFMIVCRKR